MLLYDISIIDNQWPNLVLQIISRFSTLERHYGWCFFIIFTVRKFFQRKRENFSTTRSVRKKLLIFSVTTLSNICDWIRVTFLFQFKGNVNYFDLVLVHLLKFNAFSIYIY